MKKLYKKVIVPMIYWGDGYEVLDEHMIDGEEGVDEKFATNEWRLSIINKYKDTLKPCEYIFFDEVYVPWIKEEMEDERSKG